MGESYADKKLLLIQSQRGDGAVNQSYERLGSLTTAL